MKKPTILFYLFFLLAHNSKAQDFSRHKKIIQNIFIESKNVDINGKDVIETKARGKFASIPINSANCYLAELNDGIVALAFTIYLSEQKEDYRLMEENEFYSIYDIDEGSELERIKTNERFIQLIFFNEKQMKFVAKPQGFPLEGLRWLPEGIGDFAEFISINKLEYIEGSKNACILQLYECPDCNMSIFALKLNRDKALASKKYSGCYEQFREAYNSIICKEILNCYDVYYTDAEPEYANKELLNW